MRIPKISKKSWNNWKKLKKGEDTNTEIFSRFLRKLKKGEDTNIKFALLGIISITKCLNKEES